MDRSNLSNKAHGGTAGTVPFFSLFGTPLRLHFSFILLVTVVIVKDLAGHQTTSTYTWFLLAMLASVLLHEVAHALVAKRMKVRTLEVVMFPIGGLPRMERTLTPGEEIWISIAGPLANALIAAGLFTYLANSHQSAPFPKPADLMQPNDVSLLGLIAFGNLLLVGMNLLPAFPMDGGRILRALLSYIRPEDEATRIAGWMGRMLAISHGPVRVAGAAIHAGVFRAVRLPGRGHGVRRGAGPFAHARHSGARRDDDGVSHPGARQDH